MKRTIHLPVEIRTNEQGDCCAYATAPGQEACDFLIGGKDPKLWGRGQWHCEKFGGLYGAFPQRHTHCFRLETPESIREADLTKELARLDTVVETARRSISDQVDRLKQRIAKKEDT